MTNNGNQKSNFVKQKELDKLNSELAFWKNKRSLAQDAIDNISGRINALMVPILTNDERDWLQTAIECDSLLYKGMTPPIRRILRSLEMRGLMYSFVTIDNIKDKWYAITPAGRIALGDAQ